MTMVIIMPGQNLIRKVSREYIGFFILSEKSPAFMPGESDLGLAVGSFLDAVIDKTTWGGIFLSL